MKLTLDPFSYRLQLVTRPDIKVQVDESGKWIVAAELSCAEGCPLESWSAE